MVEIQLARIKSIYGDLKGLLSQMPPVDVNPYVKAFTVGTFNDSLDNLTKVANSDFSNYKVPISEINKINSYDSGVVRPQIGRVISRLEEEYGFGRENETQQSPSIVIFNKNQNEISLQINYTINDLIDKTDDEESKTQLRELRDELEKSSKNWDKIKSILIWVLNFSKELFLKVLPIILQKKL